MVLPIILHIVLPLSLLSHVSAVVEDNPDMGRYLVGRGCYPNNQGVVELDAAIMRGADCALGAVCAIER